MFGTLMRFTDDCRWKGGNRGDCGEGAIGVRKGRWDRGESGRDRCENGRDRDESGRDRDESGRDRGEKGRNRGEKGRDRGGNGKDRQTGR
jgi:hypothetical protein